MVYLDKKFVPEIDEITLKSIDQSVTNWFTNDNPVVVDGRPVPVIYATAERWARIQKEKGFRNEAGTLILPLVSIRRTTPDPLIERYAPEHDETNITYHKRISTTPISNNDRQPAWPNNRVPDPDYMRTKDEIVYEIMQVPFPSFTNLDYEVTIWASYMTHQNLNQENIMKEFRGGRQYFKVDGYYFFGQLISTSDESNLEDFSDQEKVIKYVSKLRIQAYFIERDKVKSYRTTSNAKIRVSEKSFIIENNNNKWPS